MVNNITTSTETEEEERLIERIEKVDNGEMSFEAVPCMFKSRQEDGAEESLFGLLIRPAIASNNTTELNNKNGEKLSDDNNKHILMASTSADNKEQSSLLSNLPNSMLLPSCSNSVRGINPSSVIFASKMLHLHPKGKQIPSITSLPFLPAPSGVPPILPRPKQQKRLKNILLKNSKVIPIQPKIATTSSSFNKAALFNRKDNCSTKAFIELPFNNSSLQVLSSNSQQLSSNNNNNTLSISTSLAASCSNTLECQNITSGLLTTNIHSPTSPKLATIKKCQKRKITPIKENKRKEEKYSLQKQTPNKLKKHQKNNNKKVKQQNQRNSEVMLGEDLHEIDLSQLVNSTVITTEDYLPSQSEPPIYTNMDMYNTNNNNCCIDLHQQTTSNNIPLTQQQRLNFVEHSNNNQSLSSSIITTSEITNLQRPLLPSSSLSSNIPPCQYNNNDQQQSFNNNNISTVSVIASTSNSQSGWHPYLVTHPCVSHISSTPDSGIQSIDGSPPSVYTPPMVSPYSSQVRSCESVSATGHGISIGIGPSTSFIPSTTTTISSFPISISQNNNNFESFLQLNNCQINNAHLSPQLIGQQQNIPKGHENDRLLLNEQEEKEKRGVENEEEEEEPSDFSDMPKLIPITFSQHDESLDGEENKEINKSKDLIINNNVLENNNEKEEEIKKSPTKEILNIHKGMTLQELAECISSSIPPEQLKQLTSLIQLKAVNPKETQIIDREIEKKLSIKNNNKEIKEYSNNNIINNKLTSKKVSTKKIFAKELSIKKKERNSKISNESSTTCFKINDVNNNNNNLLIYRNQVRLQLKQKLNIFIDKVCNQLENTHLNIQKQQFWKSSHHLKKLDWKLINKRLKNKKENEQKFRNEIKKQRKRRRRRLKQNDEEKEEIINIKKHCNKLLL